MNFTIYCVSILALFYFIKALYYANRQSRQVMERSQVNYDFKDKNVIAKYKNEYIPKKKRVQTVRYLQLTKKNGINP